MILIHSFKSITLILIAIHLSSGLPCVNAAPTISSDLSSSALWAHNNTFPTHSDPVLVPRAGYIIVTDDDGRIEALTPDTQQTIPQGIASDGAGSNFDAPSILWIAYSFLLGLPMMFVGVRLGRISTGVGLGLTTSILAWASISNGLGPDPTSDLIVVLVVFGFCFGGILIGTLRLGMYIGMVLLGITGGLSLGLRLVIIKQGLLISSSDGYVGNWAIVGVLGGVMGGFIIWKRVQRLTVAFGCSAVGTFLVFLAADLVINKQSGMSRGLRFLCDRNPSHIVYILTTGYKPPASTQVLLGVSLGLTPICTYAQHRFFTSPFLPTSQNAPDSYYDPTMGTYASEPNATSSRLSSSPSRASTSEREVGTGDGKEMTKATASIRKRTFSIAIPLGSAKSRQKGG